MSVKNYKYRLYPNDKMKSAIDQYIYQSNQAYNISINLIQTKGRRLYDEGVKGTDIMNTLYRDVRASLYNREIYDKSAITQDSLRAAYNTLFTNIKKKKPFNLHYRQSASFYGSFIVRKSSKLNQHSITFFKHNIPVKIDRPIPDKYRIMGYKVKREIDQYYLICTVTDDKKIKREIPDNLNNTDFIGFDSNQNSYDFSNGRKYIIDKTQFNKLNNRYKNHQKKLSKKKKGSINRYKQKKLGAKTSLKIVRHRRDSQRKLAHKLYREFRELVFVREDLSIDKMVKKKQDEPITMKGLRRNLLSASHSTFFTVLDEISSAYDRFVIKVDPAYTSQTCSTCGAIKKKSLSERIHSCDCGLVMDRDLNAAINIKRLGTNLYVS